MLREIEFFYQGRRLIGVESVYKNEQSTVMYIYEDIIETLSFF